VYLKTLSSPFISLLLGNLAGEQPTGAQKRLIERKGVRGDYHSSTREG